MSIKEVIQRYMDKVFTDGDFDYLFFMLTDITQEGTWLLFAGDCNELFANTFQVPAKDGFIYLPGILSRKKQVVPPLLNILKEG